MTRVLNSCCRPQALVAVLSLAACGGASDATTRVDDAPLVDFTAPAWRVQHDFEQIDAIRELSDGRLVVLDRSGVFLLGADGALVRQIGRKGGGPGEYQRPAALLERRGDTTVVVDAELQRLLILDPRGEPVRVEAAPAEMDVLNVQGDEAGTLVFDRMRMGKDLTAGAITSVYRVRAGNAAAESLFTLRQTPTVSSIDTARGALFMRLMPHAPRDAWILRPDGAIGVAFADPFHVEWWLPDGTHIVGPAVPYPVVPISAAEREKEKAFTLPANRPAFQSEWSRADTAGRFWVVHQEQDSTRLWSAFDRSGTRVHQMRVPAALVPRSFGRRGLYVVRYDDDDLPWLELYRWRVAP